MKPLNVKRLRNTSLPATWSDFLIGPYTTKSRESAIQMVILFSGSDDSCIRKIGHRLALLYAKHTKDYSAIHAVASMTGLAPVTNICELNKTGKGETSSLIRLMRESFSNSLKEGEIYLTAGQKQLKNTFLESMDGAISVVAPTSYGKSSLISEYIERTEGNICVIVPTKSLLAQTRRTLLKQLPDKILKSRKVITHHEMFEEADNNIIAVLTQERLLRLLQSNSGTIFSHLIIDESHNLLENDNRARGLASSIIIAQHRNKDLKLKFLSPFIADSKNLTNRIHDTTIQHLGTNEYVKSELIYHIDLRSKDHALWIYDQFMDRSYIVNALKHLSATKYVLSVAGNKNIIYLNRPIKTHEVAKELIKLLPELKDEIIGKACRDIASYLNKDYLLVACLKRGIIFHHGSVPDNVRLYLEYLYTSCQNVRFVITTSTLLEGVNLPAEKMFLFDIKKGRKNLSSSQLKNLMGRVSRFREAFASSDLSGLLPEIHFVGNEHFPKNTNSIEQFLRKNLREGKEIKDAVENPLLENATDLDEKRGDLAQELDFLGNAEPGVLDGGSFTYKEAKTQIGRFCYLHRITDFDVFTVESKMDERVTALKRLGVLASNAKGLVEMINEIFLKNLPEEHLEKNSDMSRLRDNIQARDFYAMILGWRTQGYTYQRMISEFIGYWKKIETIPGRKVIFAGTWGNRPLDLANPNSAEKYIDISTLTHPERITLSIARIESEMAFLDYNVMRYIECLRDLELIAPEYLELLKFGTPEKDIQSLIQAGMSHTLAELVNQKELKNYIKRFPSGAIGLDPNVTEAMEKRGLNEILINEARYYTR